MPHPLLHLLTDSVIRRKAGARTYQRGHEYYTHGHVESVRSNKLGISAIVRGQYDYEVTLSVTEEGLDYSCDCPMGDEGDFCKHCVAAGLAFLLDGAPKATKNELTLEAAAAALANEPSATIAKLIAEWAEDDSLLSQRLLQYAARRAGPESALAAARAAFKKAAVPRRYVGYEEASSYGENVDRAIDVFEELIDDGHAALVVDLCEWALRTLDEGAEMVHDDGEITGLSERLLDIHVNACRQAATDPIALAQRLFKLELDSEADAFYRTAITYAEILGPAGLVAYRTLAEDSKYANHPKIEGILESVARASGDVDWLVSILERDLTNGYSYRKITEVFQQAGRHDEVLLWAERGLKKFPSDFALRDQVANEYHRRGEHSKAIKLIWPVYTESPGLHYFKVLEHHASRGEEWPEWRDNAIGLIRQRIASSKGKVDSSSLVEVFLYEKNVEEAWNEARKGNCHSHLWLQLAEAREKDHPGDAAPIYLRQAEAEISRTTNGNYDNPVALLIRTAAVMKRIGASTEFARQLDTLRAKYKIKRNFIKLLDHRRAQLQPK